MTFYYFLFTHTHTHTHTKYNAHSDILGTFDRFVELNALFLLYLILNFFYLLRRSILLIHEVLI
jgi:hypothetical protein